MSLLFFFKPLWRPGGEEWYKPRRKRKKKPEAIEIYQEPPSSPQETPQVEAKTQDPIGFKDALLLLEEARRAKQSLDALAERFRVDALLKELREKQIKLKEAEVRERILKTLADAVEREAREWQDQKDLSDLVALADLIELEARI